LSPRILRGVRGALARRLELRRVSSQPEEPSASGRREAAAAGGPAEMATLQAMWALGGAQLWLFSHDLFVSALQLAHLLYESNIPSVPK